MRRDEWGMRGVQRRSGFTVPPESSGFTMSAAATVGAPGGSSKFSVRRVDSLFTWACTTSTRSEKPGWAKTLC